MKNIFYRLFVSAICIGLLTSTSPLVSAKSATETSPIHTFTVNEYDLYISQKNTPDDVLIEQGYTPREITELKEVTIEEKLLERSRLPEEILHNMGYTDQQIDILKSYDGGSLEDNPQLYGTFADLEGFIYCMEASSTQYLMRFYFTWSNAPAMCGPGVTDILAANWRASSSSGTNVNVSFNSSRSSCAISYVNFATGNVDAQESKDITVRDPYGNAEVQFPVGRLALSWAKEGYLDVCLSRVGMGYVHEIAIGFGYGHQTLGIGGVSVSFNSTGSVGLGISFNWNMEEMYYGAATCTSSGKMTWY